MATVKCPKCAGPVAFDAGSKFVKCSYCDSQIFIDKSGAGFYYVVPFMVDEANSLGIFRRWASGPSRAKDLDKRAQIAGVVRQYFPVYLFRRDVGGKEEVVVEPAASTTLPGLHSLKIPAGDMKIFDGTYDTGGADLVKPDIDLLSYTDRLPGKAKEQALVYFPIWRISYVFEQRRYEVVLDASSGEVFASEFPHRSSGAYMAVAGLGFMAFAAEGLLAVASPWLGISLMALTVVGIFGAALFVSRRL
jgi:DNA-directed RNA polymerase subunit RPC12/RpoP